MTILQNANKGGFVLFQAYLGKRVLKTKANMAARIAFSLSACVVLLLLPGHEAQFTTTSYYWNTPSSTTYWNNPSSTTSRRPNSYSKSVINHTTYFTANHDPFPSQLKGSWPSLQGTQ